MNSRVEKIVTAAILIFSLLAVPVVRADDDDIASPDLTGKFRATIIFNEGVFPEEGSSDDNLEFGYSPCRR